MSSYTITKRGYVNYTQEPIKHTRANVRRVDDSNTSKGELAVPSKSRSKSKPRQSKKNVSE